MRENSLLLGIDIGTSSIKCVIFNRQGEEVATSHRIPVLIRKSQNFSEISMEFLWEQVSSAIEEVVLKISPENSGKIIAIGISGTACGCWLLGSDMRPIRDAILWNDGRSAEIVGDWQKSGVLDEIFKISGNSIFPGYPVAVIRWLKENEPESLSKAKYNIFCKDWIRYRLTGEIAVDHSDMGYFPYDICNRRISEEILEACKIEEFDKIIPRIIEPGTTAGFLKDDLAQKFKLHKSIPVIAGLVDVAAATLGGGAHKIGQACSVLGTSFLNTLVCETPSFKPFGLGVQTSTVGTSFIRSMVNTSGTINLQWFLDNFCGQEQESMQMEGRSIYNWAENTAADIPIGSCGIIYHPYINTTGVVSPFVNPAARAQFFGVSINHSKAHFLRSIYEGTALAMLDCYENIPENIQQVFLSGGGARSDFWCQILADCTGKEIILTSGSELGAKGVALLAGCAGGLYQDIEQAAVEVFRINKTFYPDSKNHQEFLELYNLYKSIYTHLSDDWWQRHNILRRFEKNHE